MNSVPRGLSEVPSQILIKQLCKDAVGRGAGRGEGERRRAFSPDTQREGLRWRETPGERHQRKRNYKRSRERGISRDRDGEGRGEMEKEVSKRVRGKQTYVDTENLNETERPGTLGQGPL